MIETRDLSVSIGTREILRDVDLRLMPGQITGLVGESGSGKSMAALSIIGLLPPGMQAEGQVTLDGGNLLGLPEIALCRIRGKRIGMIFQEPMTALNPLMNIGDQVAEVLRIHQNMPREQALLRARDRLDRVGLPAPRFPLTLYPHELSGGQRQRVAIALAIAEAPDLLIADEPTTALDVTIQAQILELLTGLQRDTGMALVLITHDMGVVAETVQRVQVQYAGQRVELQEVDGLFENPHHPYTAALLAALPERATEKRLPTIPGVVPGQFDRPHGCLFSPRCSFADARCIAERPRPAGADLGYALCHYPLIDGLPTGKETAA